MFVASGFSFVAMVAAYFYVHNADDLGLKDRKKNDDAAKAKDVEIAVSKENENKTDQESQVADSNNSVNFVAWKEIRVWIISGQTFCTTMAFNGVSSLMALLLLEPRLGVVSEADTVEMQGRKVGLWVSAFVPTLALTQMVVLMTLFPKLKKNLAFCRLGALAV